MKNTLAKSQIKNFLLYGGKTKNEYQSAEKLILRSNHKLWRIISFITTFVFIALAAFAFIVSKGENGAIDTFKGIVCGAVASISIIPLILLNFVFKAESLGSRIMMYFLAILVLGYGIFIGNLDKDMPSVTFMVVLVLTPIAIVDKPYRIITLILSAIIAEIITVSIMKNPEAMVEDLVHTIVFGVVTIGIDVFLLQLRIKGFVNERILRKQAYVDSLTGLGNELSYLEKREELDKKIKEGIDVDFGIVMFDVNDVKKTNDTYGHIYGCAKIVEAGHYLKQIFESSKVFHIGGDEFLAVVMGSDLNRIDNIIHEFDSKMENYYLKKNDLEMKLVVARGFALYNRLEDKRFSDVLAKADKLMYENKRELKNK
ncbi:MAG: GGDEF domain-containing protein [Acholeplasmatales bacterium]|nr:GGDEF domain-containing protein [Acholeplasmatales bacterium]